MVHYSYESDPERLTNIMIGRDSLFGPNHHDGDTLMFQTEWRIDRNFIQFNVNGLHRNLSIFQGLIHKENDTVVHYSYPDNVRVVSEETKAGLRKTAFSP